MKIFQKRSVAVAVLILAVVAGIVLGQLRHTDYTVESPDTAGPSASSEVLDTALDLGLDAGFMQERSSAREEYTPPFDLEGL